MAVVVTTAGADWKNMQKFCEIKQSLNLQLPSGNGLCPKTLQDRVGLDLPIGHLQAGGEEPLRLGTPGMSQRALNE